LVVCENFLEDTRTRNKSLINLFDAIRVLSFPAQHHRVVVLASLAQGQGKWPVAVEVRDPTRQSVASIAGEVQLAGRDADADLVFEFLGLPLPRPGRYMVVLKCGGARLASRKIDVQPVEQQQVLQVLQVLSERKPTT
jgi:hypothetical protein